MSASVSPASAHIVVLMISASEEKSFGAQTNSSSMVKFSTRDG